METLVWPEQVGRLSNLQAALRIGAGHKPRIVKGDLLGDSLKTLCRERRTMPRSLCFTPRSWLMLQTPPTNSASPIE
ncbi:DUF2332 family protein [Bradyrhizobium sp.]|uniref:DUF2332 family protein n=1 Tax=Bradyrhizobium sp. TaxID=376 RepID=UPI003433080C